MKFGKLKLAKASTLTVIDWAHIAAIGVAGSITAFLAQAHLSTTSASFVFLTTLLGVLGVFNQTSSNTAVPTVTPITERETPTDPKKAA
jgi:hypothetical protein